MINSGVPGEWAPHIFSVLTEMPRIMLWVQAYWGGPGVNRCGSRFCRRTSIHYFQVFRSRAPLLPNHGRGRGDAITAVDLSYTRPCGRNVFVTQITLFGRDTIAADCGGSVSPPPPPPFDNCVYIMHSASPHCRNVGPPHRIQNPGIPANISFCVLGVYSCNRICIIALTGFGSVADFFLSLCRRPKGACEVINICTLDFKRKCRMLINLCARAPRRLCVN